jgi:hypothetical protein
MGDEELAWMTKEQAESGSPSPWSSAVAPPRHTSERNVMADQPHPETRRRLDRAGRALMTGGAAVIGLLGALLTLGAAWFISYFGDGSAERGLAAMLDVWFVWLLAVAVIVLVAVALVWTIRGSQVALVAGGIAGLTISVIGMTMLSTGHDDGLRWLLIIIGAIGGFALALGSVMRLVARSDRTM